MIVFKLDYFIRQNLVYRYEIDRERTEKLRVQGTLIPILIKLFIDDHMKWYKYVSIVRRIMNSTCSRSTN